MFVQYNTAIEQENTLNTLVIIYHVNKCVLAEVW